MAGVCSRPHLWYGEFEASRTTSLIYGWADLDLWNWWILSLYTVMKELTSKLKLLYLFRWDMWHKLWSACDFKLHIRIKNIWTAIKSCHADVTLYCLLSSTITDSACLSLSERTARWTCSLYTGESWTASQLSDVKWTGPACSHVSQVTLKNSYSRGDVQFGVHNGRRWN